MRLRPADQSLSTVFGSKPEMASPFRMNRSCGLKHSPILKSCSLKRFEYGSQQALRHHRGRATSGNRAPRKLRISRNQCGRRAVFRRQPHVSQATLREPANRQSSLLNLHALAPQATVGTRSMRPSQEWRERRPAPAATNRSLRRGRSAVAGFYLDLTGGPATAGLPPGSNRMEFVNPPNPALRHPSTRSGGFRTGSDQGGDS
jgi:hypothetical protein